MAKFGSNRLSRFDSTIIKLMEEDGFSTKERDGFSDVQIFNPPQLGLKSNPALAMSGLRNSRILASALPKEF